MKLVKCIAFLFAILGFNVCYAQKMLFHFGSRDTNFIKEFERQYTVQLSTWYNRINFVVDPTLTADRSKRLVLSPNLKPQVGVGLGLRYFSLSISTSLPFTISDRNLYGETKFFDFTGGYFRGYVGAEMFITKYQGLYQNETGGTIKLRTAAELLAIGANGYYAFNHHKFSFRSAIKNQELQLKNAGSIVLMASIARKAVDADTILVNSGNGQGNQVAQPGVYTHLRNDYFSLRPGYAYNFSFKKGKYFISPAVFLGGGLSRIQISKGSEISVIHVADFDLHSKIAAGYNHSKFFWNIYAMYDSNFNKLELGTTTSFNNYFIGFNLGYRFLYMIKRIHWI